MTAVLHKECASKDWEWNGSPVKMELDSRNHLNSTHSMNNPNSSTRPTLKLRAARKPAVPEKAPSISQPDKKPKPKPGAHWSDEYKERMQADMDALLR